MSRVITRNGFNLPSQQIHSEWNPSRVETIVIPSTSAPSFGGYYICDIRETNCKLVDLTLQLNLSALTGSTSTHFVPTWFWFTRIELAVNNIVVETLYPTEQFLRNQLYEYDEQRLYYNLIAGNYASTAQRIAMCANANSYYLPLRGFFKAGAGIPLLNSTHNIQLRLYMDTLSNITAPAGSPVATLNSCNVLAKVVRLRPNEVDSLAMDIQKRPQHFRFQDSRAMFAIVNSGVSSTNIVLTGITGNVSHLLFTVRPSSSLVNDNDYQFTAISSFAILDSSSTNITGGVNVSNQEAQLLLNRDWTISSYCAETALGLVNNYANVYMYSFCADPVDVIKEGKSSGTYRFIGAEQLQINFASTLGANVQVDIYAYVDSVLEIGKSHVKKIEYR